MSAEKEIVKIPFAIQHCGHCALRTADTGRGDGCYRGCEEQNHERILPSEKSRTNVFKSRIMKNKIIGGIVVIFLIVMGVVFAKMNSVDLTSGDKIEDVTDSNLETTEEDSDYETLVDKADKTLPEIGDSPADVEQMMKDPSDWRKDGNHVTYSYYNYKGVYYKFYFKDDKLFKINTGKGW